MKLRSCKTMALWFAMAVLVSSTPAFASEHVNVRGERKTTIIAYNTIIGNLNDVFIAQAFAANPVGANVVALTAAEIGPGTGSMTDAISTIKSALTKLGAHTAAIEDFGSHLALYDDAAIAYGLSVATGASPASQQAALDAWIAVGNDLAFQIVRLRYNNVANHLDIVANFQGAILSLIQRQEVVIQSYKLPNFAQAVHFDEEAHEIASNLARSIVNLVVSK